MADYDIIKKGCNHNKKAFILANKSRQKYKYRHTQTKKIAFKMIKGVNKIAT